MSVIIENPRIDSGRLMITRNAKDALPRVEVDAAINRHLSGDWGDVCEPDGKLNEEALVNGDRIFSVYHTSDGVKFWIITESDRSATTVLLPSDY